jgi:hypothetical protein
MKKIKLSQGKYALVDDEDFEYLNNYKWSALKDNKTYYAVSSLIIDPVTKKKKAIKMHRVIMKTPKGMDTDHINGDGLDNRRENLRVCTHAENSRNRGINKNNTSGYKGVYWKKDRKKWAAQIRNNGKVVGLGGFDRKEQAYAAYCQAAKEFYKDFAKI